ncbi:MAG: carboxypeptidase regulatory-like domain-containing protein, partial [bacterium]|nr:carboxypeptidase regulatory-like domain-containing protein [bacterium]
MEIIAWSLSKTYTSSVRLEGTGEAVEYTLAGLKPASDYVVELTQYDYADDYADNYAYQVFSGRYSLEDADLVDLSDNDASDIDFTLISATTVISGRIIFPNDALPGATARIDVFSRSSGAKTGKEIKLEDTLIVPYEITGLIPAEDYIVYISSDKYMNRYYDATDYGAPGEQDAQIVNTAENPVPELADFRLGTGTKISGSVIDKNDAGAAGINVEAWSAIAGSSGSNVTSEDGNYMIEGLDPAPDYIVRAWDKDLGSFFYNSEATVLNKSFAGPVSTSEGDQAGIDVKLIDLESISGIVTDLNGYPLYLMWVEAWSELMGAGNGIFTDQDGRYEIKGLPSGRDYTVSARPDWFTVPQEKFNVSSGSIGINFSLDPMQGYKIQGIVIDRQGNPIPGARVEAWSDTLDIRGVIWSVTDRSGKYEISGVPGADDYMILAWPPDDSPYAFFSGQGFSVPLENDTVNIELAYGLVISGTITARDGGAPLEDIRVTAVSNKNNFRKRAITGKNGFYEITNVPEGSNYEITVTGGKDYLGKLKTAQAPGGGIDFVLESSGSVTGKVTGKITGEPFPNAIVEAYSESRQGAGGFAGSGLSGKDGFYNCV